MPFRARFEDLACGVGVADRGLLVEAEHGGEVKRIGAVGEGFLELPVDAEPFQGRGLAAQRPVTQTLLAGPVSVAVLVDSRWGLAVFGQRVRRCSSQSSRSCG